jgi:hypothetical protein
MPQAPSIATKWQEVHVQRSTRLRPLWTFDAVLDAIGGPKALSRLTGQSTAAIHNWRRLRSRYPAKYYFAMKCALADRGFYAPISLWGFYGMHAQPKPKAA